MLPIIRAYFTTTELLYLPVKFSRSILSITAPKSTSDEGTEMGLTEIVCGLRVMVGVDMFDLVAL